MKSLINSSRKGGVSNAEESADYGENGGEQNDRAGSIGSYQSGVSGVYEKRGAMDQGWQKRGANAVPTGIILLSPESQSTLSQRGVVNVELHDSSTDNAAFSFALNNARSADKANGWAVTPKSAEELNSVGVKTFMDANGATGFGIAPDGDIEAVFSNKTAGAPKGSTKSTIPQAIANGGTKLDCYGPLLVDLYSKHGFVPVARATFNPEYANDGWTPDKGTPDIYFMMHNGESADSVVQNYGNYHIWTQAELDALPIMEYDDAYAYRDGLLSRQNGATTAPPETKAVSGAINEVSEGTSTLLPGAVEQQKTAPAEAETEVIISAGSTALSKPHDENGSLGYTLATNLERISDMAPVTTLTGRELNDRTKKLSEQIAEFFKGLGNKVFRSGFGEVALNDYGVGGMLNHRPLNRAKVVSLSAVPDVIKSGRQIGYSSNWKGRGYASYVFAAPVTLGEHTLYVAAVVDQRPDNKFYLSEMVDSNGNYVRIEESPSGNSKNGVTDGAVTSGAGITAGPEGLSVGGTPSAQNSADPVPPSTGTTVAQVDPVVKSAVDGVESDETESVGAAPSGFDPYSNMIAEYGIIPEGENPTRLVDVPKSTNGKDKVSLTARTAMEAEATPNDMVGELGSAILEGKLSYIPINNAQAEAMARATIKNAGDFSTALANWTAEVRQGKSSAKLTAMGALLYNEAANSGNTKQALSILSDYAAMVRHGAQAVQAARILKTLSPENKLLFIQQSVDKMNEATREKKGRNVKPEDNVPVEEWMKRVGEDLAEGLAAKAGVPKNTAKTVSQEILSDLKSYANSVMKKSKTLKSKTAEAKFFDLLNNWTQYNEAIESARKTLQDKFADNPAALATFNEWLNSSANSMLVEATGTEGDIVVDETYINEYLEAKDDAARDKALDKIYQNIADQVPSSLSDKFTALRYLNMLGNLRTQARNITGNLFNMGVRSIDHHIEALLQGIVHHKDPTKRDTTFFKDRGLAKQAKADFDEYRSAVMGEQKYSPTAGADNNLAREIEDRRTVFKNNGTWGTSEASGIKGSLPVKAVRKTSDLILKGFEGARNLTSWAMETGDEIFAKHAYSDAMSRYLKAKGYTAEQWSNGEIPADVLDAARAHSIQEAQEATFRDSNAFSDTIAKIGFKNPQNAVEEGANLLVKGVLPFRKTPANVAVQAEKHSPLGLLNTAVTAVQASNSNGEVDANDVIKSLSETLTGTGLFALGFALAAGGLTTGGKDDNEELAQIDDLQGFQEYAITIPGLGSYTYDFATPAAMPFAMGVELQNAIERNGGVSLDAVMDALGGTTEVALNMSMLQGLNDAFENVSYSDAPLLDAALNAAVSYFTQGLTSTLGGQIERTFEDVRMTTYRDKEGTLPTSTQYNVGKVSQKLPGWDYNQIPYIDAWGRTEESGALPWRALENFLSPGYVSAETTNAAEDEIRRLAEQGFTSVAPDVVDHGQEITYKINSTDEKSRKRYMSADEYVEYATIKGETSLDVVSDMIKSDVYKGLTDEEKAKALQTAYSYAGHIAANEIANGKHPMDKKYELAQTANNDLDLTAAEYLLLCEKYGSEAVNGDKIRKAYSGGMDPVDYLNYNAGIQQYDADGNHSYTVTERGNSIENSGMDNTDQLLLWEMYYPKWKEKADANGIEWATYVDYKITTADASKKDDKISALVAAGYTRTEAENLYKLIK